MSAQPRQERRWDRLDYQRILAAAIEGDELVVTFADGTQGRVAPSRLVPEDRPAPDWSRLP